MKKFNITILILVALFVGCTLFSDPKDDDNGDEYTLMFSEKFDGGFPNDQWTTTGPLDNFIIDNNKGGHETPSLRVVGGETVSATMFTNGLTSETGLRFMIGVALPDDSNPQSTIGQETIIQIVAEEGDNVVALLAFSRNLSGASFGTQIYYSTTSGGNNEQLNWGSVTGQFMAFAFTVNPDGSSEWSRNGVRIYSNTSTSLSGIHLKVRLRGVRNTPLDVNFDDVEARVY